LTDAPFGKGVSRKAAAWSRATLLESRGPGPAPGQIAIGDGPTGALAAGVVLRAGGHAGHWSSLHDFGCQLTGSSRLPVPARSQRHYQ
jgi:hypothetical protein